jgi:hypothetical protein
MIAKKLQSIPNNTGLEMNRSATVLNFLDNHNSDLTIWRTGMEACAHWVYIRDNKIEVEQSFWLFERLSKDKCDENQPCTEPPLNRTYAVRSLGPMLMCCCVPHEYDDSGVLTCTPDNPLTKFACEKKDVAELVPFQLGVSKCFVKDQYDTVSFGGKTNMNEL